MVNDHSGNNGEPPVSGHSVRVRFDGPLAFVELHRPRRLNAVNVDMVTELQAALRHLRDQVPLRAVIIHGAGRAFCAGHDLRQDDLPTDPLAVRAYIERMQDCFRLLRGMPTLTIAAVHGHAVGAGCELALACDLVVAAETTVFRFPEVEAGLAVGGGVAWALPAAVGLHRAKELILLGRSLSAADAAELGLVNQIVSGGTDGQSCLEAAVALAEEAATRPPLAFRLAKAAIDCGASEGLEAAFRLEVEHMTLTAASGEAQAAAAFFLGKHSEA